MDNELSALSIIFTEFYYWVTVVLMFLIHVGFCLYEVAVAREKNKINTLMKNSMLIPVITVAFFFFGWWLYFAFQNGPGITGGLKSAAFAEPWNELMGTHMGGQPHSGRFTGEDTLLWSRLNGVFWAAFLLFSWTAVPCLAPQAAWRAPHSVRGGTGGARSRHRGGRDRQSGGGSRRRTGSAFGTSHSAGEE